MKKFEWLMLSFLSIILIFGTGCSSKKEDKIDKKNDEKTEKVSVFKESEIELPKDAGHVLDILPNNNGQLMIVMKTKDEKTIKTMTSENNGKSWEDQVDIGTQLTGTQKEYADVRLAEDGRGLIRTVIADGPDESNLRQEIFELTKDKKIEKLSNEINTMITEQKIQTLFWVDEKQAVGLGEKGSFLFDMTSGNAQQILSEKELVLSFEQYKNNLYFLTLNGFKKINLENAKVESLSKAFTEANKIVLKEKNIENIVFAFDGKDDQSLLLSLTDDIVKVSDKGQQKFMEKRATQLSNPKNKLLNVIPGGKKNILAFLETPDGNKLFNYNPEGQKEVKNTEANTLKIYALTENELRQNEAVRVASNDYENKHTDIKVSLEIGVEDGVTFNDALKKLNTQLASGDGPDILLLDGVRAQNYIDQNLLLDLAEIIKEQQSDKIFTNVLSAYKQGDKYYGLPMTFAGMSAYGDSDLAKHTNSLKELTDYLVKLSQKSKTPVFENYNFDNMMLVFYRIYYSNVKQEWTKQDVTDFYTSIKRLYDLVYMKNIKEWDLSESTTLVVGRGVLYNVALGEVQTAFDYVDNYFVIEETEISKKIDKSFSESILKDNKMQYYIPQNILAISSKSDKQDQAYEFLKNALSEDVQSQLSISGIPVSKQSFKQMIKEQSFPEVKKIQLDSGKKKEVQFEGISETTINQWTEKFEGLNKPSSFDDTIFSILMENIDEVVSGKMSPKSASKKAYRKIELYMAE
ncbi:ABC transporter substrate-binding protein [Vagococcus silagei]|uniref:Extracellular solute-binding protein n=1 Tax=Vagococcus silagei TaxID=2508885 RepID=A0A4S3B2N7_9ENTE|nr:extracellular solute-binding protein [Vagococcus silagei]THB60497.1 extracellular solute-binding protein [Vagococcus silagei]